MDRRNKLWISFYSPLILAFILHSQISQSFTDERDVSAINSLFTSLGSPAIPGWIPNGGDPCTEAWQGVQCVNSNITSITINAANLGGVLGDGLGNFLSIISIDLSNNNIGGSIPENLPSTIQQLFLSANLFTGSIPASLSNLTFLSALSVNNNHLDGQLPDSFQSLTGLINLDFSANNLSGPLPPSMAGLSSLTTFHMQQNQFTGVLDVLENLPLKDLNIENNSFSGPIPAKLLSIPTFKKDGNPFNTTVIISPSSQPASAPGSPFFSGGPSPPKSHSNGSSSPSSPSDSTKSSSSPNSSKKSNNTSTLKIIGYVIVVVVSLVVLVLISLYCVSKYQDKKEIERERESNRDFLAKRQAGRVDPSPPPPAKPTNEINKVTKETSKGRPEFEMGRTMPPAIPARRNNDYIVNMDSTEEFLMLPPPPPPPVESQAPQKAAQEQATANQNLIQNQKVTVNPISLPEKKKQQPSTSSASVPPREITKPPPSVTPALTSAMASASAVTSATSFSVGELQQYTESFSEGNLIRESRLGLVYLAQLPHGELLEVMKIDNANSRIPVDEFLELVANLSELRHPNVLELVGYCAEFGQRLLVYSHFCRTTLQDVLYCGDEDEEEKEKEKEKGRKDLSWGDRMKIALGAAKALEYLHEGCGPETIVHQNFEPYNILLDKNFSVRIAECGLASLMATNSVTQLSGRMRSLYSYEAPEINESGSSFTEHSDVYSFGVVMLELLTGRKPYDPSRPRTEQHLVRWASSQLHDIDALSRMVDPTIQGQCSDKSLSRFADIISRCIQHEPEFRPPMSEIVQDLTPMIRPSREPSN